MATKAALQEMLDTALEINAAQAEKIEELGTMCTQLQSELLAAEGDLNVVLRTEFPWGEGKPVVVPAPVVTLSRREAMQAAKAAAMATGRCVKA